METETVFAPPKINALPVLLDLSVNLDSMDCQVFPALMEFPANMLRTFTTSRLKAASTAQPALQELPVQLESPASVECEVQREVPVSQEEMETQARQANKVQLELQARMENPDSPAKRELTLRSQLDVKATEDLQDHKEMKDLKVTKERTVKLAKLVHPDQQDLPVFKDQQELMVTKDPKAQPELQEVMQNIVLALPEMEAREVQDPMEVAVVQVETAEMELAIMVVLMLAETKLDIVAALSKRTL